MIKQLWPAIMKILLIEMIVVVVLFR